MTKFDPEGVNLCLYTLASYCKNHLDAYASKTGRKHFLNIRQTRKATASDRPEGEEGTKKAQITKLAIGKEGGIDADKKFEVETAYQYRYLGQGESPIKEAELAGLIKSVLEAETASKKTEIEAWEAQILPCEHTLTLNQETAKPIARRDLAHCGLCELDSNLWICLECGHLGCGRKNYDGTGGNGHALSHYETSGHSLVVKSGTISAEGNASVFCYLCDNDVKDDNLPSHLAVLGIKVDEMQKTEKTMAELELEANLTLTLSKTWEQGKVMVPVFGPKKTGLENIGNSCYLASVVQCLANIPEVERRYHTLAAQHMDSCTVSPQDCITCQACKLFSGLISGNYSIKKTDEIEVPATGEKTLTEFQEGIKPRMFKQLLGKGHQEFSTSKQQDAMEYLIHLLSNLTRVEQAGQLSPITNLFDFEIEVRAQCPNCPAIQVTEASSKFLNLPVPLPESFDSYGDSGKQEDLDYSAPLSACLEL